MIRTMIFDLDGTLVQTECLKVLSYTRAAGAAGMWCIAVTTPFIHNRIHGEHILDERWVVGDPNTLHLVVKDMIAERKQDGGAHKGGG